MVSIYTKMTLTTKTDFITNLLAAEGGYVNDPRDSGGETNYGITVAVARENGYTGAMRELPRQVAIDIYLKKYWHSVRGDELPPSVSIEVADTAVNMGVQTAAIFLQRAISVLHPSAQLKIDGNIGAKTVAAVAEYCELRDAAVLVRALNCLQGARYIELAESREKNKAFVYGWIKNRVAI